MIYLLDTHALIWATLENKKLSKKIHEIIVSRENEICVSTVSFWEISLKTRIGNFSFDNVDVKSFPQHARNMGFSIIDLKEQETITFHELPLKENHKDPFDRMLIWQAMVNGMAMISKDDNFKQYKIDGLKLIW
jgi:PIN domain nuclease of toxin-antitoxin system